MGKGVHQNHQYLAPALLNAIGPLGGKRALDIGCGDAAITSRVSATGLETTGLEMRPDLVERNRKAHPDIDFRTYDVNDPLPDDLRDRFDIVISAEVIEHLLLPRLLFKRVQDALIPGGHVVITTPFHGYWKNLAIALAGKSDRHWAPWHDYGHIKFFSEKTLGALAEECGFRVTHWDRAGRLGPLSATMLLTGQLTPVE